MKLRNEILVSVSAATVFLLGGVILTSAGCSTLPAAAKVTTYAGPRGEPPSDDFCVRVDGKPVFVYQARVSAVPFNQSWPGYERPLDQTEIASFACWDMSGPVTVEVVSKQAVDRVAVRPTSYGIQPKVDGNRITFALKRPRQVTVEVNGSHKALHLFANPPETDVPRLTDANVRYFGPGMHRPGKIVLKSNETVYIAGGAVVHGVIEATEASNLRILGRGILDVSTFKRETKVWAENDPSFESKAPNERVAIHTATDGGVFGGAISLCGCQNVHIEGIVIRDSNRWTLVPAGCRGIRIANVKLIGLWRFNTDGINIVNSEDVTIDGCFIRSFDDSICIKGQPGRCWHGYVAGTRPVRNVTVSNCVIWNDWGTAFQFGDGAWAPEIAHLLFRDCDIIRTCHIAMGFGPAYGGATIQDVRFEDIRVEIDDEASKPMIQQGREAKYTGTKGDYCPRLIYQVIGKHMTGSVRNVLFKNITVTGSGRRFPLSILRGFSAERCVENVVIENLRINGKLISDLATGGFTIGKHVKNVKFQ